MYLVKKRAKFKKKKTKLQSYWNILRHASFIYVIKKEILKLPIEDFKILAL